jgi:hypothetical protein
MAVPTTAVWTLDTDQILDEAWARVRRITGKPQSGYELKRGVRALQLLMAELGMRGVQLWSVQELELELDADENDVALPDDVLEVIEAVLRDEDGIDIPLPRMSRLEMLAIPDKDSAGRPLRYWIDRGRDNLTVRFWPVPDATGYTFLYHGVVALRDVGTMVDNLDVPSRWMPCLVSGLAWFIARGTEGVPSIEVEQFKSEFEADYLTAVSDDRERVPLRVVYDLSVYTRT